ncbi:fatty acid desaturase family protein [Flavobacterium franklandianum]|nr:fatty acid desaturase [Flavobacterium franklandianum]
MFKKPTFIKSTEEDQNFILLKEKVKERLSLEEKNYENQIKAFVLPFIYFLFWCLAIQYKLTPALYFLFFGFMGIMTTLIFVNLIHEACHNTLFEKKWKNKVMMYFFDCMGANSFIWMNRHISMHHNYPNTIGWDSDIEQGNPLKLFPSETFSPIQKYQHYWIFLLYPLFLLNWLLVRDFRDFYSSKRYIRKFVKIPLTEHFKLWFFKLLFFSYAIIIPVLVFNIELSQAIVGFLVQMICGSLLGMVILLTPHVNVGNEFPITNEDFKLQTSWIRHQFNTTNDLNGENFISKHLMNNFNYHLAHHLFPNINSAYLPKVTEIIKEFALEHQFPYKSYSLIKAFRLHHQLIKKNAIQTPFIFEETM